MTDFDTQVKPGLHRILAEATVIENHSNWVCTDVADLPARPQWVTKAEDALEQAELALTRALSKVRSAREFYKKVKVEQV